MVFHRTLSDNKFPQVFRTLLSFLAVLNNTVFWMVSTRPPTSKASSPVDNPLVTEPKAPIPIGIIVTFMLHSFFNYLARSRYLSFFSHYYYYYRVFPPTLADGFPLESVIKSLFKLPGLFLIFWPISTKM